jgi:hypothetical protein
MGENNALEDTLCAYCPIRTERDKLTAENKELREALDTIESMATDSSLDIQGVAQDALKPPTPQEYDDSSSTIEEQKAFEEGCLERLDILTK